MWFNWGKKWTLEVVFNVSFSEYEHCFKIFRDKLWPLQTLWQGLAMKTSFFFHYYYTFIFFLGGEKEENSWTSKHIHMRKLTCCVTLLLYIFAFHLLCALRQFFVDEPYVSEPSLKHPAYLWIMLEYQVSHLNWAKELW